MLLPPPARAVLDERLGPIRIAHPEVRWAPAHDHHLTLVFLGDTEPRIVPAVLEAVADSASHRAPFEVSLHGAGSFGGRGRPLVAWLGVAAGSAELVALAADLRGRIAALPGLGMLAEAGTLRPHLTIARRAPATLPAQLREALAEESAAWKVETLVLVRSYLERGGARHEVLATVPLGATAVPRARDVRS